MEFNWIFRCPACKGPIANWVVQETLVYPGCKIRLKSNVRAAIRHSFLVVLLAGLLIWLPFGLYTNQWITCLLGAGGEAALFSVS